MRSRWKVMEQKLRHLESQVDYLKKVLELHTKQVGNRLDASDTLRDDVDLLAGHLKVKFYTQPERPPRRILVSTDDA